MADSTRVKNLAMQFSLYICGKRHIVLAETKSGEIVFAKEYPGKVTVLEVSPRHKKVFAVGGDFGIEVFDLEKSHQPMASFGAHEPPISFNFFDSHCDGFLIFVGQHTLEEATVGFNRRVWRGMTA